MPRMTWTGFSTWNSKYARLGSAGSGFTLVDGAVSGPVARSGDCNAHAPAIAPIATRPKAAVWSQGKRGEAARMAMILRSRFEVGSERLGEERGMALGRRCAIVSNSMPYRSASGCASGSLAQCREARGVPSPRVRRDSGRRLSRYASRCSCWWNDAGPAYSGVAWGAGLSCRPPSRYYLSK